jgi:putative ABC transport system permease protein
VLRRLASIVSRLGLMTRRRRVDDGLADEVETHLELLTERYVRAGMPPAAARRAARHQFGNTTRVREDVYWMTGVAWLEAAVQDFLYALRALRARPRFTALVLAILAIGIGANVSMFSLVDAVLLRPLPYPAPDRLVHVWEVRRSDVSTLSAASYPTFLDWRRERGVFAELEAYDETNVTVTGGDTAEFVNGARVSSGFLGMLGASPVIGGGFTARDDVPGGTQAVILSDGFWTRHFGANRAIIGTAITINGLPYDVRGVLPRSFHFAPAGDVDVWLPLARTSEERAERFNHWVEVVGRLDPGVTLAQARHRMSQVMADLAGRYPETNRGRDTIVRPLADVIVGGATRPLLVLSGAVGLMLLIVCANVANLGLARSLERRQELALRTALGASRGRLARQLLIESLVLTVGGAVLGAWLAAGAVPLLLAVLPASVFDQMPALRDASVDVAALGFASALTLVAGLSCGLIPALRACRGTDARAIRSGARAGGSREHQRVRDALVAVELALALVLLVGAALIARSLVAVLGVDPGFDVRGVATVRVALAGPRYADGRAQQMYFEQFLAHVRAAPGVERAGAISSAPLQRTGANVIRVDGAPEPDPSARPEVSARAVAGDYFQALHIPLLQGRLLDTRDTGTAPYVVVISESLARRLFGARAAVGERIRFDGWQDRPWTIVGVVGDVKTNAMDEAPVPSVYYSHLQGAANRMSLVARGSDAATLVALIRREARALDPDAAVYRAGTMVQYIAASPAVSSRQYVLALLGAFAIGALVLAGVGVYGVIAYTVSQRDREMAIRMALGAGADQVLSLVLHHGLRLAAVGVGVGTACALGVIRVLSSLLFGVSADDPWTYLAVSLGVVVVALGASYLPARRAARADPATLLKGPA